MDEFRVSIVGQGLVMVGEVTIIKVVPNRNTPEDLC